MRDFTVEKDWIDEKTGLDCVVIMGDMGTRCGYVGVDKNNEFYNKDYDELDIDVHGGLTFAGGGGIYPVKSNLWFFGYDCAHLGDKRDISQVKDENLRGMLKRLDDIDTTATIKTLEYCIAECEKLAEQLKKGEKYAK